MTLSSGIALLSAYLHVLDKGSSILNVIATSLPLDCCDCLDWSQKSTKKTHHNHTLHSSVKRVMVVKSSFSRFHLVSSFPTAFTSLSSTMQGLYERCIPASLVRYHCINLLAPPFPHPFAFSQSRSLVVLGSR